MLQVFAAASLTEAFHDLGAAFEALHPEVAVRFNFAGSQQLAAQIEQGAHADVFASADERWARELANEGLLADSTQVFARNRLVVILPSSNPGRVDRLQDLARPAVKLVLAAESVPAGDYSRAVLRRLATGGDFPADFAERALKNVVSNEENVKAVVTKVQLGEADAGFVYRTDVTAPLARLVKIIEIPADANVTASYPIAVTREGAVRRTAVGAANEAASTAPGERDTTANPARAFVAFVLSPEGQTALATHGFLPAHPTGAP
ncbi:MAG: molybdate ABC transporter substrate-binding protein [Candidatus Eisenbacteria bacterium]